MSKRISVINFKGGVGKTTLALQLAAGLARYHGARVLLVDVDHQSSLSIVCMGAVEWRKALASKQTIVEIFRTFTSARSSMPGQEIIHRDPFARLRHYRTLDIVPSSLDLDDIEIELTASHQGNAIQSE